MKKIFIALLSICCVHFAVAQITRLDSLNARLKNENDPAKQMVILGDLAEIYGQRGETDLNRKTTMQMLKVATDSQRDSLISRAYLNVGSFFSWTNDYKQALEYNFKALEIAEKANDYDDIWFANKEIGVIYKDLKNYPSALKYLRKAEQVFENSTNELLLTFSKSKLKLAKNRVYSHMAESYLALGDKNQALKYVQLANNFSSATEDGYGFARVLYVFAKVYQSKGHNDLAESYYKKCIDFAKSKKLALPFVSATHDYGKYLLATSHPEHAKKYARESYRASVQSDDKLGLINGAALLQKSYAALNLKDSAYYFADVKESYRDSIFNEQQTNQIQNLSFAKQLKEKEDEEKRLREDEARRHQIQYAILATAIITFFIFFLLLSRTLIVNEKWISFLAMLALLLVFEFINLLIHPFLGNITHHSPSLMLLCMVLLASLLIPMHHKLEHYLKHKLIEKNKAIRLAAAKKTIEQLESDET